MALSLINKDQLGAQRVMNHLAQANPDFDFMSPTEVLGELEKLQASPLRIGGQGFGRGRPRRPLTPFLNMNMTFDPEQIEEDEYLLTEILIKWSANKQIMWGRRACRNSGFIFKPIGEAPNAHDKTLVPLDPIPQRPLSRPAPRVAVGRVSKAPRRTLVGRVRRGGGNSPGVEISGEIRIGGCPCNHR